MPHSPTLTEIFTSLFPLSFSDSRVIFFMLLWSQKPLWQSRGFCAQALHSRLITDRTSSFFMNKSGLFLQSPLGLFKRPLPALRQEFVKFMLVRTFSNKQYRNPINLKKATWKGRPAPHDGLAHSCHRRWGPQGLSAKVQAVASLTNTASDAASEKWGVQHCPVWFCNLNIPNKMCSYPSDMRHVHLMLWFSGMMPTHSRWISTDPNKSLNTEHPHFIPATQHCY